MNALTKLETAVPFEAEGSQASSGLGCLVIVARHHGFHLSVSQLIHDNVLTNQEVSVDEIVKCAKSSGLTAKAVELTWGGLAHLKKTLPVIVRLRNGGSMVLRRLEGEGDGVRAILQDPNADADALLVVDRVRFEDVWTGEVILVKRDYEISDEEQPFGIGLVTALLFRERWVVRDVAICALFLGFVALSPIIFWRLMSDRVLYFHAYSTFWVLCLAMVILIVFEAVFTYLRQFLVLHLSTRVDVKLSTYVFEKVLNLPIDFFERTHTGKIVHDIWELRKIRAFLVGQMMGTILDTTVLLFFIPVMFFFSPIMTAVVLGCAFLAVAWLLAMLPHYRKMSNAAEAAETECGSFLVQTIHGMRTVKSLALDARQRQMWDVHTARVAKSYRSL